MQVSEQTERSRPVRKQLRGEKVFMRISKAERALLFRLAAARDVSASQLMRQALKRMVIEAGEGGR